MNSRSLLLLFILLIASESGRAQGKTSLFSAPVTVSGGVEHVMGSTGTLVPESALLISPIQPLLVKDTPRSTLRLSYSPELEFVFNGSRRSTFWNHAADFAYNRVTGRRTRFDIGHSFVRSSDPARLFADNLFALPRNNFRENSTVVAMRHDFTRATTLGLRFDNTITRISGPGRVSGTYLDQYGVMGTASLTRRVTEHQRITGSYSLLKFNPYRFFSSTDASGFMASIPTVRAGISRFALSLAMASAESATAPAGLLGGTMVSPLPASPVTPTPPGAGPVASNVSPSGPASVTTRIFAADPEPTFAPNSQNDTSLMKDPFHSGVLTYSYIGNSGLLFELAGGVMADRDPSYLIGIQVKKGRDRLWTSLGAHHYLSYYGRTPLEGPAGASTATLPPGTRARSDYTSAALTLGGKLGRKTELEFSAIVSESKANFVMHHARALTGRGRISHWFTDKFGVFVTADTFWEDRNDLGASSSDRQRYFGGVQFRLSEPRRPTRAAEK